MQLTVHHDAASFLETATDFLREAEAENSILAVPAARIASAPADDDADTYLASVQSDGSIVAAALHGPSGGVLVTTGPDAALAMIAADIAARGRHPTGVVGPPVACAAFAEAWCHHTGAKQALRFRLRHFELTQSPDMPASRGRMRRPDPDEQELLASWQTGFIGEVNIPDDPARRRAHLLRRIERGMIRVWDDAGPVSFGGYTEIVSTGTARIAPVYTPPHLRRRGYATALVAELSRDLLQRGNRAIFLTTDLANPTSNGIYRRIGYSPVADHVHVDLLPASR